MLKEFDQITREWTSVENIYKELYLKKQLGINEYRRYLNSLDQEELKRNGLNIPDLFDPIEVFPEVVPIFSIESSVAVWKHSRYTPPSMHAHDYFELIFVAEGKAYNTIENNPVMEMGEGDLCILSDRVRHSIEVMSDDGIVINIMIKKSTFRELFFDILTGDNILSEFFWTALQGKNGRQFLFFQTGKNKDIRLLVEQLFLEYYRHDKYYEQIVRHGVFALVAYLMRGNERFFLSNRDNSFELKLFQYINKNYADCSLETAAKHFNYSTAYMSRLIKRVTHRNFSELLTDFRLTLACKLLQESNLQIIQICEEVGFKSVSHFNHVFKDKFGVTPTAYRLRES